jgi:predicted lipoprotein with Yx(FWY)xxD motif
MRHPRTTLAIVGLVVAAAAGTATVVETAIGSSTPVAASTASHPRTGTLRLSGMATVQAAKATVAGRTETVLVTAKGLPLYIYKPDTATRSLVTGQLAALWPPLRADAPTASRAVGASGALTVAPTTNGPQVAYNGHFLYTFTEDSPGRVTGQGIQDFFVATPGLVAQSPAPALQSAAPAPARVPSGY